MRRPMHLNLSWRCNKGRVGNKLSGGSNYRALDARRYRIDHRGVGRTGQGGVGPSVSDSSPRSDAITL